MAASWDGFRIFVLLVFWLRGQQKGFTHPSGMIVQMLTRVMNGWLYRKDHCVGEQEKDKAICKSDVPFVPSSGGTHE